MGAGKGKFVIQAKVRSGQMGKKPSGKWVDTTWTWPDVPVNKRKAIERRNALRKSDNMGNEYRAVYRVGGMDSEIS